MNQRKQVSGGWLLGVRSLTPCQSASLWTAVKRATPLFESRWWPVVAVLCGAFPYALFASLGCSWHQSFSSLVITLLMLPAALAGRWVVAMAFVAIAFATHSSLAILHAALLPQAAADCMPGAAEFWVKQHHWIRTGRDPEYLLANWLPAHAQLLAVAGLFSYLSFGWLVLWQGLYEVDLMNFYVGRLIANSSSPWLALGLGWHPWSALRGVCYLVLVTEVASWSFARLVSKSSVVSAARRLRWALIVAFFFADCLVKGMFTESVRTALFSNLLEVS